MTDLRLLPTAPPGGRPRPPRGAAVGLAAIVVLTAAALAALPFAGRLAPAAGLLALAATGAVVLDRLATFHPHPRFGLGNAVTAVRAGGTAVFVALALEPGLVAGRAAWTALGLALALLALDGVDGWLARRQGLASAFGARFDMEVDALLVLALAALAFGLGKAGGWVLAIGLMRYAFVAAGRLVPALAAPLPPSARRRAVCAFQIGALALLLAPPVAPPLSAMLAAAALAALAGSFAADVARLLARP
jgi:phosphatidylglycerophosphate synthase